VNFSKRVFDYIKKRDRFLKLKHRLDREKHVLTTHMFPHSGYNKKDYLLIQIFVVFMDHSDRGWRCAGLIRRLTQVEGLRNIRYSRTYRRLNKLVKMGYLVKDGEGEFRINPKADWTPKR